MRHILVDVDTQRDFVSPSGALHVPASPGTLERIEARLRAAASGESDYAAIIGSLDSHAYDAWEFEANGGPFPAHCVKGQEGWLRSFADVPGRQRFIPMGQPGGDGCLVTVGETRRGEGNRSLDAAALASEALDGVGLYFEKEVYSLFHNPLAEPVLAALVERLGGADTVCFDVIGYCTGGYCVDAAAEGLASRGYRVRVLEAETAAIGGRDGAARSRTQLTRAGVTWIAAPGETAV